jgi:hypothetical protein
VRGKDGLVLFWSVSFLSSSFRLQGCQGSVVVFSDLFVCCLKVGIAIEVCVKTTLVSSFGWLRQ